MAERAGIVRIISKLIAQTGRQADIVRGGQEPVELQAVRLCLAAHVLVERERAIHKGQLMIVDVTQTPELAEEPPGLDFEVPRQRRRLQCRLFDAECRFARGGIGRGIHYGVPLGKRVH